MATTTAAIPPFAPSLIIKTISSFTDFLKEINDIGYVSNKLWFRGNGDSKHTLTPSLFRHKHARTQAELKALESNLNQTFEMRSLPYTESRNWAKDEWERLFFMQHYRVPTRLLDWSGSPLVALHFALTSVKLNDAGQPKNDAAVWIFDPIRWNKAAYADTDFSGDILSPNDAWLQRYSPTEVYKATTSLPPVAMRGVHNSARIVAQQGFFTVFGPSIEPMEKSYLSKKGTDFIFPQRCLIKIVIPKINIDSIRDEVFSLGISESMIYPDIEGLATELKRLFGF